MACAITGSGTSYPVGRVVTGAEALTLHLTNSTTDVTTTIASPGLSNYFTIWMRITDGGVYDVFTPQYGCWGYFVRSGTSSDVFEVEIVENNNVAVEILLRCNDYSLGTTINGVTSSTVSLRIRVEEGKQGVFLGWHSNPQVGPQPDIIYNSSENNNPEYGERELGTGGGSVVVWSSANPEFVSRHPAWGQRSVWAAAEAVLGPIGNRASWCGIDDADYAIYATAAFAATQFAGFPNTQSSAPWYVADIADPVNVAPVCRYIVMRKPIETGVWQFNPVHTGSLVCHFNNEWLNSRGEVFPFQIFIGAFKYTADSSGGYINEPTQTVRDAVLRKVMFLEWPGESGRVWLTDKATPNSSAGRRRKRTLIFERGMYGRKN